MIIIKDGTPSFKVTVPPEDMCIGYDGENMVRRIVFSPPAGYDGWTWRVDLILADGGDDVVLLQLDGDVLAWDILDKHLVCPDGAGKVKAQIRANNPATPLQTKKSNWFTLYTQSSIDAIDKICVSPSEIAQAEKYMDALLLDGQTARAAAEEAAATAGVAKQEAIRQAELAGDAATGAAAAEQEAAKERAAAEEAAKQTAADRLVTGQDRAEVERLTGQVRADREQVGKDREAVAGDKAAAETAKTGAEAAEAEVIKQAGIATDQVALATEQAERAKAEADRAAGIDAYTKNDADSRYLRATEIRRPFADGVITLADADDAAFGGVTVLGATTEAGTGDKGPDNPYTLAGVQPTKVTVCGRNLLPSNATSGTTNGLTRAVDENGVIHLSGTAAGKTVVAVLSGRETPYFWLREKVYHPAEKTKSMVIRAMREDGTTIWTNSNDISAHIPCGILSVSYEFPEGTPDTNVLYPYLGLEPNQPYEPYAGQTTTLPALAPLYGDGDIRDEYDAATGVETRRWKRVVFDGTEKWNKWREDVCIYSLIRPALVAHQGACNAYPIFKSINWNAFPDRQFSIETKQINFRNDACADVDSWKAYLNAQATAGTPVTVVYQLDAPVVTQHGPQRIPTYPGCTNLMLDISAEGAVRYPLSAPMQWDAKADKTAADDRYANVLTGTASGPVAALEDVSPTGALRRAAVLGATAETGEGDKGPDNPYTIAGVQPTKITVCGKNLLAYPYTSKTKTEVGVTFTDLGDGAITCSGTCTIAQGVVFSFRGASEPFTCFPGFTYSVSGCPAGGGDSSVGTYCIRVVEVKNGTIIWNNRYTDTGNGISFQVAEKKQFTITFTVWGFATVNNLLVRPQIEVSPAATPYEPYTGQTITLPALAPLYGDGTVCDEYDAVSGVETRRWKQVVFDGTEGWSFEGVKDGLYEYVYFNSVKDLKATNALVCTHYIVTGTAERINGLSGAGHIYIKDASRTTRDGWKAYLAAQYAAGTPVTVLYQLDEPVITQHDPARILPPAPVCRVFADAGGVDVGYNRDVNSLAAELEDLKATIAALLGGGA